MSRAGAFAAGRGVPGPGAMAPQWPYRLALVLLAACALFVLLTFAQHGISNDEEVQHVYGRLLVDFYTSGFADRAAFEYKNLYLYGGLFDLVAAVLERFVPVNVWDLRHLLSAAFGLTGLAGTWLLARRLAGEWAGLLALVVLALTGAWSGAMFTHTKDVSFAATMVWALYFTTCLLPDLPRPRRAHLAGVGIALGCAFGLRVGAVFGVFYLTLGVVAAAWLGGTTLRGRLVFLLRAIRALLPAGLLAFVLMGLFWPWAVMSPGNLLRAMTTFSHFSFELHTILDGEVMKNGEVPGYYLASYLLVRLPELFLLGLGLALLGGLRRMPLLASIAGRRGALAWLPVVLAVLVPLAYTLAAVPPLYNGIRHFTFLLPPLAVLAGSGLIAGWTRAARWPRARLLAAVACGVLALSHLTVLARLHPYEYVYYNGLAGGVRGAAERWEEDYWADSLREAAVQLNAFVAAEGAAARPYSVAVCAESLQAAVWLAPGLTVTRDWRAADFFLAPTHMDCDAVLRGRIVGEVRRDGITLAVVRDRRMLTGTERNPR